MTPGYFEESLRTYNQKKKTRSRKMSPLKSAQLVALLALIGLLNGVARAADDQKDATAESRAGYPITPNYANNYVSNHGGYQHEQYGQQQHGIRLVLDSSCKRYSCIPTTSPLATCSLVCSPDGRTPFCPIWHCLSASGATCSDFKCTIQTFAQQPYH